MLGGRWPGKSIVVRRKLVFVFGLIVSAVLFCGPVAADLVVPKFVPELRVNKKAELCKPLLRSWRSVYGSTKFLRLTKKQLAAAFGIREVHQVGGHRTPQLFSKGLDGVAVDGYRNPQQLSIDLDGDEIEEHLLVSAVYRGLRYEGTAVYLFRDAAHRDEVAEYSEERR